MTTPSHDAKHSNINGHITVSLDRQWKILTHLNARRWTGTQDIKRLLALDGIDVSLRTIQRDLNQLAERFPLESDHSTPQGWRWQAGVDHASFPLMNSSQALTFIMVESYLADLLPPTLLQQMQPWFNQAKRSIGENNKLSEWINHIQVLPASQPLIPPAIDAQAQANVYEALLDGKQLIINYAKRQSPPKDYRLNPVAIVHKGGVIYLLATKADDTQAEIRQFAMHRIVEASIDNSDSVTPLDFSLAHYIDEGHMGYHSQSLRTKRKDKLGKQKVKLVFEPTAGASLLESRLSADQSISINKAGDIVVTATLPLTQQLGWWLRGFGKGLKAISPQILADFVYESTIP